MFVAESETKTTFCPARFLKIVSSLHVPSGRGTSNSNALHGGGPTLHPMPGLITPLLIGAPLVDLPMQFGARLLGGLGSGHLASRASPADGKILGTLGQSATPSRLMPFPGWLAW
ncbi:hypothetical protein CB0940_07265 [Cercospora beticola]|uniref:Uncharacterized protein n=1 Tax=Cercospora beticola TaxID=122368 RepID=A0A2G5H904_CERBT|nr:hypothetical protein CB0940_07265 [Cercospora beticola]PIA89014.1 hypothetical protein CB0940_07265 [Cercospora beticola]